jgi:hypothetical protein
MRTNCHQASRPGYERIGADPSDEVGQDSDAADEECYPQSFHALSKIQAACQSTS